MNISSSPPVGVIEQNFSQNSAFIMLFERAVNHMIKDPGQIIGAVLFPLVFFLLFSLIMSRVMQVNNFDYDQMLPAGIVIQAMIFTAMSSASVIATDYESGLYERFNTMPFNPMLPSLARVGADLIRGLLVILIITILAISNGMIFSAGIQGVILYFVFPLLFLFVISLAMGLIGHLQKDVRKSSAITSVIYLPLIMISTAFTPISSFPQSMQQWVSMSPVTQVIDVMRMAVIGNINFTDIVICIVVLSLLAAFFMYTTRWVIQRQSL